MLVCVSPKNANKYIKYYQVQINQRKTQQKYLFTTRFSKIFSFKHSRNKLLQYRRNTFIRWRIEDTGFQFLCINRKTWKPKSISEVTTSSVNQLRSPLLSQIPTLIRDAAIRHKISGTVSTCVYLSFWPIVGYIKTCLNSLWLNSTQLWGQPRGFLLE